MADAKWNENQIQLAFAMLENAAGDKSFKWDWNFIASKTSYGNAASAASQWNKMKHRMQAASGTGTPNTTTPKPTKKRTAATNTDDDASPSAAKKARGGTKKQKKEKSIDPEDLEGEAGNIKTEPLGDGSE